MNGEKDLKEQPTEETAVPAPEMDPEIQEQVDIFMANGLRMIHSEEVSSNIVNSIVSSQDPLASIAKATVSVVNRLEESAAEKGVQLQQEALIAIGNQLMGNIIEMAEIAGVEELTEEERAKAFSLAVSEYLGQAVDSGKITQEQLVGMGEQAQQTPEGQKIMETAGKMMPEPEAVGGI